MTHDNAAERQRDEPDGEGRKGSQPSGDLRYVREELRSKRHRRCRAVNEEVLAFDCRADAARNTDTTCVARNLCVADVSAAEK